MAPAGVSINVMKETGGKVIFVFHGKEQIAFANKNQTQYSGVMTKLSELKNQGVEFRSSGEPVLFASNQLQVHQILAVNVNATTARSAMPWRPTWDTHLNAPGFDPDREPTVIDLRDSAAVE